jgi:ACT domain-containing protein
MTKFLKMKIVLLDVSGSLISALNMIHSFGFDYREVHCTKRVDDQFDLIVDLESRTGPSDIQLLCAKLQALDTVLDIGLVGKRKNPQRA